MKLTQSERHTINYSDGMMLLNTEREDESVSKKEDKADWVQLKIRVPKSLKYELKVEAATLEMSLEAYLLALAHHRFDGYRKMKAQHDLNRKNANKHK